MLRDEKGLSRFMVVDDYGDAVGITPDAPATHLFSLEFRLGRAVREVWIDPAVLVLTEVLKARQQS